MYEIRIPDHIYQQAAEAAQAHHLSLEEFIIEAVQLHAQDEPDQFFTPQRIVEIKEAATEGRGGDNTTFEQHKAEMQNMRTEWQENRPA